MIHLIDVLDHTIRVKVDAIHDEAAQQEAVYFVNREFDVEAIATAIRNRESFLGETTFTVDVAI